MLRPPPSSDCPTLPAGSPAPALSSQHHAPPACAADMGGCRRASHCEPAWSARPNRTQRSQRFRPPRLGISRATETYPRRSNTCAAAFSMAMSWPEGWWECEDAGGCVRSGGAGIRLHVCQSRETYRKCWRRVACSRASGWEVCCPGLFLMDACSIGDPLCTRIPTTPSSAALVTAGGPRAVATHPASSARSDRLVPRLRLTLTLRSAFRLTPRRSRWRSFVQRGEADGRRFDRQRKAPPMLQSACE